MKVTLMGPDDLDCWFLTDDDGISFPLVARHEDHPAAAALFGWMAPEEITDQEDVIESTASGSWTTSPMRSKRQRMLPNTSRS